MDGAATVVSAIGTGFEMRTSVGAIMPESVGTVALVAAADARIAFNPVAYFGFACACESDPVFSSSRGAGANN